MNKNRVESFSDGMFAIFITVMVLGIEIPHKADWAALQALFPVFGSYIVSFIYVGIYWNNHHHMLHAVKQINGSILWANLHLLFWLSLVPFVTGWVGENYFAPLPMACYGFVLLMAAIAYALLQYQLIRAEGADSLLALAVAHDFKGKSSPFFYLTAIVSCLFSQWIAAGIYAFVALMWLVPDRRIELFYAKKKEG